MSMRVTPGRRFRPFRRAQAGYIGIAGRRAVGGGNLTFAQRIAALLNGSEFFAPLTHSLVLERGTGAATLTRATEKRFTDNEGRMLVAPAGCAAFTGARFVRNGCITASEDFSNAVWVKSGSITVTGTNIINYPVANQGLIHATLFGAVPPVGSKIICQAKMSGVAGSTISLYYFDGTTIFETTVVLTETPTVYVLDGITTTAATLAYFYIIRKTLDTATQVTVEYAQVENITGRADGGADGPSEYVSVGAGDDHGSGADGCKFFDTDLDGNPLTTLDGISIEGAGTNLCLQSNAFTTTWGSTLGVGPTQNQVGPDGGTTGWYCEDNSAVASQYLDQNITLTAAAHTFSLFVKKTSGATTFPILLAYSTTTVIGWEVTVDTNNGVATAFTASTDITIGAGTTATCTSFNDDYWRVAVTFTGTAVLWRFVLCPAGTSNATQSTGGLVAATVGSAVFYGADLKASAVLSSYIPTTTTSATRNADVLYYGGADLATLKALSATYIWNGAIDAATNFSILDLNDSGTTTNSMVMRLEGGTAKQKSFCYSGSALQANLDHTSAAVKGTQYKTLFSVGTNDAFSVINGGDVKTDATSTPPVGCIRLSVGSTYAGNQQLGGNLKNVYGWARNPSQSEAKAITA